MKERRFHSESMMTMGIIELLHRRGKKVGSWKLEGRRQGWLFTNNFTAMRSLNLFFTVIFILFAGLQYNDPDPLVWIPIYLYAAFLCWRAYKGVHHTGLYIVGLVGYLLYGLFLFFDKNGVLSWASEHAAESLVTSMKAEKPWIEETREFGGLVILIVAISLNLYHARRKKGLVANS